MNEPKAPERIESPEELLDSQSAATTAGSDLPPVDRSVTGAFLSGTLPPGLNDSTKSSFSSGPAPTRYQLPTPPPGFTIQKVLGEGGMGIVYLAHQQGLNRSVALKTLKPGSHVEQRYLIRFLAEAESVAAVRHPNVVEVYQFGEYEGKPYLALEFCPGGDLSAYAKAGDAKRTYQQIAELMLSIADGVQAAHALGIVHRDLKPANVLLTANGTPKVTDFGLAKRGTGTDLTKTTEAMGTPAYMSPEQAGGGTKFLGPESDVWALGVMLYELISGERPFAGSGAFDMVVQVLAAKIPPLKSKCIDLPKDLELIVNKCLQREPKDRYATAGDLANDLRNWLEGKAITARPMGGLESLSRWAKRNRRLAGAMGIAMLAMVLGTGISVWQAIRANAAETKAKEEALEVLRLTELMIAESKNATAESKRANDETLRANDEALRAKVSVELTAFIRELFTSSDPSGLTGAGILPAGERARNSESVELVKAAIKSIREKRFQGGSKEDQISRSALLDVLGDVTRTLGDYPGAKPLLDEAVAIRTKLLGDDDPATQISRTHLANWHAEKGDYYEAESLFSKVLDCYARTGKSGSLEEAETQLRFSATLAAYMDMPRAEAYARKGLATRIKELGPTHRDTAIARMVLAACLFGTINGAEALKEVKLAFDVIAAKGVEQDPVIASVQEYQQGMLFHNLGLNSKAVDSFRLGNQGFRKRLGDDHLYLAMLEADLGFALWDNGDFDAAEKAWDESLRILRKTVGIEFPRAMSVVEARCDAYIAKKDPETAWRLMDEAMTASTKRYGANVPWRPLVLNTAIQLAFKIGKINEGNKLIEEAAALFKTLPNEKVANHFPFANLACTVSDHADYATCKLAYDRVFSIPERQTGSEHRWTDHFNYGFACYKHGKMQEAERHLLETQTLAELPEIQKFQDYSTFALTLECLARLDWKAGRLDSAEKRFAKALEFRAKQKKYDNRQLDDFAALNALYLARGETEKIAALFEKYGGSFNRTDTAKAWLAYGRIAVAKSKMPNAKVLEELEKAVGKSVEVDASLYRTRAVALGGGNIRRELERVEAHLVKNPNWIDMRLAKATCLLRLGDPDAAIATLETLRPIEKIPNLDRLRQLLLALARYRSTPNDKSFAAIRAKWELAEKQFGRLLDGTEASSNAFQISTSLEVRWWCNYLREEFTVVNIK